MTTGLERPDAGSGIDTQAPPTIEPISGETDPRPGLGRSIGRGVLKFLHVTKEAAKATARSAPEICAGTAAAAIVALHPAEISLAGNEGTAQIQLADHASFDTDILGYPISGGIDGPGTYESYFGLDLSAKVEIPKPDLTKLTKISNEIPPDESPKEYLTNAITESIEEQAYFGTGVGLATFGFALFGRKLWRRKREERAETSQKRLKEIWRNAQAERQLLAYNPKDEVALERRKDLMDQAAVLESKINKTESHKLHRKIGAMLLGLAIVSGTPGVIKSELNDIQPAPEASKTYLPDIAEGIPLIEDMTTNPELQHIYISADSQTIAGIKQPIVDYKNAANGSWSNYGNKFAMGYDKLENSGKLKWTKAPGIVPVLHYSDLHGDVPNIEQAMPKEIEATGANVILLTGDTYNGSNVPGSWEDKISQPMEHILNMVIQFNKKGHKLTVVKVNGNHDPKNLDRKFLDFTLPDPENPGKRYHPIIQLNETTGMVTTVGGVTFAGISDPSRTTAGAENPTWPESRFEQAVINYEAGDKLADAACQDEAKTGHAPIVAGPEYQTIVPALLRQCTTLAVTGEIHKNLPIETYQTDGDNPSILNRVLHPKDYKYYYSHIVGSSSGAWGGEPLRIYSVGPKIPASFAIYYVRQSSNELVGSLSATFYPTNEEAKMVKITLRKAPRPENAVPFSAKNIQQYDKYDPEQTGAYTAYLGQTH